MKPKAESKREATCEMGKQKESSRNSNSPEKSAGCEERIEERNGTERNGTVRKISRLFLRRLDLESSKLLLVQLHVLSTIFCPLSFRNFFSFFFNFFQFEIFCSVIILFLSFVARVSKLLPVATCVRNS